MVDFHAVVTLSMADSISQYAELPEAAHPAEVDRPAYIEAKIAGAKLIFARDARTSKKLVRGSGVRGMAVKRTTKGLENRRRRNRRSSPTLKNCVLFVGAGFSAAAKIPTTSELLASFVSAQGLSHTPNVLQGEISYQLQKFWSDIFGWSSKEPDIRPTFESHFTTLDLAANTGHQLKSYTPSALRAIRRMSLHRVFETLDTRFSWNAQISELTRALASGAANSIVSTNWDMVVEKHLARQGFQHCYGTVVDEPFVRAVDQLRLIKLHGSANWSYCDVCRRVVAHPVHHGKVAYRHGVFLECRDFQTLRSKLTDAVIANALATMPTAPDCPYCRVRMSARVATFSFEKALGFFQFQGAWEDALRVLRTADRWIFIGYSLPDADFSLRHLLKTAQLSDSPSRNLKIDVVLNSDGDAAGRFRQFFGARSLSLYAKGFVDWWVKAGRTLV